MITNPSPPPKAVMEADTEPLSEAERVLAWRELELLTAGYAPQHAELLAARSDIDLRLACTLVARGCPEHLAVDILA